MRSSAVCRRQRVDKGPAWHPGQGCRIGYKVVESAGFAGKTAPEFRKALDAAGLKCPSSHLFPGPGPNPRQYFEDIKVVGSDYVVSSLLFKYMKPASVQTQDD